MENDDAEGKFETSKRLANIKAMALDVASPRRNAVPLLEQPHPERLVFWARF